MTFELRVKLPFLPETAIESFRLHVAKQSTIPSFAVRSDAQNEIALKDISIVAVEDE
jgi:hypothetical protein